jgi:hypothetical protein
MRLRSVSACLTLVAAGLLPAPSASAAACAKAGPGDINGDGFGDLVVTEYGRTRLQGGIHVLYGTAAGLTADPRGSAPDDQFLTQDSPGVPDRSEDADEWGAALALGDFNGDRCADLAIGAPGEDQTAGGVTVLYGSPSGLTTTGAQLLSQNAEGMPDEAEPNDRFGAALATGDFDGDGRADLAVFRPSNRTWYIKRSANGTSLTQKFGQSTDTPVPADYDGDGKADVAMYSTGVSGWNVLTSSSNFRKELFRASGRKGDQPVRMDYNGDGKTDFIAFHATSGSWYALTSTAPFQTGSLLCRWGQNGDVPVPAVPKR